MDPTDPGLHGRNRKSTTFLIPAKGAVDLLIASYGTEGRAISVIPAKGAVDLLMVPYGTEGMAVSVIPAKAGIQKCGYVNFSKPLDSHLRGNDGGVHCYVLVGSICPRHSKSTAPKSGDPETRTRKPRQST